MKKPVVGSAGFCGGRWGGSIVISIYFKTDVQQAAGLVSFEPVGLFNDKVMWLLLPPLHSFKPNGFSGEGSSPKSSGLLKLTINSSLFSRGARRCHLIPTLDVPFSCPVILL